jgi:hypothetical protein
MADYAISNVPRRVVYAASGTGPYAFTFEILNQTDIAVYKASTLLTLTTDYTVTINANGTGSVTLVTSAGTSNITIVGAKNIQRTTDFTTGGDLFANTLNDELDNQTIFIQQVAETAERGLKAPVVDPTDINMTLPAKASRVGTVLAFNATTGNPEAGPSIGAVTTVAAQSANINTVASNIGSVNTVAGNVTNVNTVAGVSSNVTTVAGSISNVNTVANDLNEAVSEINTVAVNMGVVDTVGNNITNVNTVATNIGNVNTVGGISSDVTTVATIAGPVTNVSSISSAVSAVNANATNINTVAGINAAVSTVATNNANVSTVATNIASVNTNATNIVAIQNASTNATNAATSATNAANSETAAAASAAAAAASFDAFDDIYLGAKASNPTVDNDGNALTTGDQYFNTTSNEMRVWNGSAWQSASVIGGTVTTLGVTGVATFSAGTVSAPAITTTGDTNTGIFFPAADTIAFTEGGAESMRVDSSSRLLVGLTSSGSTTSKLQVTGGTVNATNLATSYSNAAVAIVPKSSSGFSLAIASGTSDFPQLQVSANGAASGDLLIQPYGGNVGIGTSSPSSFGKFAVQGASTNRAFYADANAQPVARYDDNSFVSAGFTLRNTGVSGSNQGIGILFQLGTGGTPIDSGAIQMRSEADYSTSANQDAAMTFATVLNGTNAERMRIDSSGNVQIGNTTTSSAAERFNVNGFAGFGDRAATNPFVLVGNTGSGAGLVGTFSNHALEIRTNNTERMRIDSSGNLSIGTTAAGQKLSIDGGIQLYGGANTRGLYWSMYGSTNSGYIDINGSSDGNVMRFGTANTERMRIDGSGNVGIGTSSPQRRLHSYDGVNDNCILAQSGAGNAYIGFADNGTTSQTGLSVRLGSAGNAMVFQTGGTTERMRIDSSGNLLVNGTTVRNSGRMTLDYAGNSANGITINDTTSTNGSAFLSFFTGGTSRGSVSNNNNTGVLYNVTSDYRLKTVIGSVTNAGQRIDALQPIEYDWNTGGRTRGFLAHQFAEIYPNSVSGEKDAVNKDGKPIYQAMQSSSTEVMADLIAEIQSLRKRVAQLESK